MPSPCAQFLSALFAGYDSEFSVELRWPRIKGMGRAFYGTSQLPDVAKKIAKLAPGGDVYLGVLPRRRQASRREDVVANASVLWVDCDTPDSVAALQQLRPAPSMVVASGTGENRHAYWLLSAPVSLDVIEAANESLAAQLGADMASTDPARILRPPSLNHKHDPPSDVALLHCDPALRYPIDDIVATESLELARHRVSFAPTDDPLLQIEPSVYVEQLAGIHVPRSGKVRCPFHDPDDTPSLHVYRDPARGWYCYGCRRGGSIYDFAALLWHMRTRGSDFSELRRLLDLRFDGTDIPVH